VLTALLLACAPAAPAPLPREALTAPGLVGAWEVEWGGVSPYLVVFHKGGAACWLYSPADGGPALSEGHWHFDRAGRLCVRWHALPHCDWRGHFRLAPGGGYAGAGAVMRRAK
jgi:hypothetical protein